MTTSDARAYLRVLLALHLAPLLFAVGFLFAALRLAGVAVVVIPVAVALWIGGTLGGWVRAIRRGRGKRWVGRDSIWEDANLWTGWAYIDEAAAATGRSGSEIRSTLKKSLLTAAALIVVAIAAFPVSAMLS